MLEENPLVPVCIWPDRSWMYLSDYEDEAERWRGDDFYTELVPAEYTEEQVDQCIQRLLSGMW